MRDCKTLVRLLAFGGVLFAGATQVASAATEIQFWHAMEAALGERVNEIANQFNASQSDYKIVPVFKGTYDQTLAAGIAAYRSGNAPAILQVYEVGTATMMQAKKAIVPVSEVFKQAGTPLDSKQFVPTIASYYSDAKTGELVSMPFNSSTPVLYYNKDAFKKAGLDASQPPKTWQELADDAAKLKAAGMSCGFTTAWQAWVQLENYSAWHGLPFATRNNGFDGTDAKLEFNKPQQVAHIAFLQKMAKDGTFTYAGRKDEPAAKFYSGDCGILMGSSGSLATIRKYAKFEFGTGMMPYDANVKGAPQNAIIGGASLWVLSGKDPNVYKGVVKFLTYLSSPAVAAKWHQDTGYLPVTQAAYEETEKSGFYKSHPGADTAIRQMLNKPPLPYTKGLRLGNMPQIRTIVDEELEQVWAQKKTAKDALDSAVSRGDELLRRFEKSGT
ncbi:sn-glycerol-3-phosphate ABC transporter substrate-binding protein UgpB [Trinickia caryophylli]|uniref:sn-glycerol-3-phosphate-binding periplasmic protein UgpB n=1 Tax=Trinickia caryophylli TaxID=28094 RepID=A0A1X7F612_TRICW|nr:sn-glycerol-3-phosphate ABC transporter substrate-binding protein UgpB [Trinickia caryophylli]PMS08696.1 sn-glycerol-3-phosphate ABC transporter substrate-binding protein UgpB [Trinickia caryophylli]TRX19420.1 sn-glycerol-3-phosphate ABC transporter substrate-binding protein UgpB [Trinickia caryophylli]WQE13275.1 sn-glycerol-3-phosphate ABC transporter substrate-binding protein UgpB [Trinickia caryophylli]SMF45911.1 glycerol 3-phosphate-binding protein [Trinickia caryophylli]GLU34406.1 sn-g